MIERSKVTKVDLIQDVVRMVVGFTTTCAISGYHP